MSIPFSLKRKTLSSEPKIPMSSRFKLDAHQVNDSLYELYKPDGVPTMQVLFFHGLPFGDCSDAHLSTWISGDGSCIWPQVWLAEKFPNAHILVVSYIEGLKNGSAERFDMRIIRENLTSDLIQANIGQMANCPVVLVGHSFGGLVMKDLCLEAHNTLICPTDKAKVQKFLNNLRGLFYYSTPHHGSADIGRARSVVSSALFKYFTVLSTDAARLNCDFNRLRNSYSKWEIGGLGEQLPVERGLFQGIVIVPEASARDGETFNVDHADHFSVCRPENTISRRFTALTTLLHRICDDVKDEIAMAQKPAVRQNLQRLPKQTINMDVLVQEVKSRLKKFTTMGFVGMGGLGKTTLAKAVFNELSPSYEYSCFVPNLKVIEGDDVDEVKKVVWKHMHCLGKKVEGKDDITELSGKHVLLVLDDIKDRDITFLSDLVHDCSPQSRFIVTTRESNLLNCLDDIDIYQVPFLKQENAQQLFLSHAFPKGANFPASLERDMVAVVAKCGGLPLTLEVIGSYLKLNNDGNFWKQTLRALEKAEAIQDLDKRLWAKLRVSYDGLGEVEKQIFLDAVTFFAPTKEDGEGYLSLRVAKAAWREAYGTECESLLWRTLVDRSLVYHVEENEGIRVHDQLLSLGQKIASESSKIGKCRIWEKKMASNLLKDNSEENQDIHALRLSVTWDDKWDDTYTPDDHINPSEIHISGHTLCKLKNLHYLEVDAPLIIDGVEEDMSFPSKVFLLIWVGDFETFNLGVQDHLVVLNLSRSTIPRSIGLLSALRIFIGRGIGSVPDEFGNLSQLEYLEFKDCYGQGLPESFGNLCALNHLEINGCHDLKGLPESFGNLCALNHLEIIDCRDLQGLPESFGNLCALNHLEIRHCWGLQGLPKSFGNLCALNHLEINDCDDLQGLPESFGNLCALNHLEISGCDGLQFLPESFGNLCALNHLKIRGCDLQGLPESPGNLCALNHLEIRYFDRLQGLPESFGNLCALNRLEISDCYGLQGLPESFGNLCALNHLKIIYCDRLQGLPESFGNLCALNRLEISDCYGLQGLPESFGNLCALNHLKISNCLGLQGLPESFGNLCALNHLKISYCGELQGLPESFGNLYALNHLEISYCLQGLPDSFGNLLVLEELKLTACCFEALPNSFEKLSTLRHLELKECENFLSLIPFGKLTQLQYLKVHGGHSLTQMEKLPESLAELTALSHLVLDCVSIRRIPDFLKSMQSLHTLELSMLPYIKELPSWVGETGAAPLALSCKMFQVQDGCFLLTSEEPEIISAESLINERHGIAMEKVGKSDYEGALADLCLVNLGVLDPKLESFLLRERAIARRFTGDLKGALADLTAAVNVLSDADDGLRHDSYELFKHRGYIKYLLGDEAGARRDAERCMAMMPNVKGVECLGGLPVTFLEFSLKGRVQNEDKLSIASHKAVMEKVKGKDFLGAMAIWEEFDAQVAGFHDRLYFLQERGVLKGMAGDLPGALEDLTAALKIEKDYDCFKHRGYVKYLMGDQDGAQMDGNQCIAMGHEESSYKYLGGFPVTFLGFDL